MIKSKIIALLLLVAFGLSGSVMASSMPVKSVKTAAPVGTPVKLSADTLRTTLIAAELIASATAFGVGISALVKAIKKKKRILRGALLTVGGVVGLGAGAVLLGHGAHKTVKAG